jgi:chemotaxis protein histidine kinase CheA
LSDRFRVSAEALQRLGVAAELSGTSLDTVARGMNKMRLAQVGALNGNEELKATFEGMGISMDQLAGMGTEELFQRVADAVAGTTSDTEKLTIATAVFGNRMAGELIPLLEQGGERIRALGASSAVMSEETIRELSAAKDQIEDLKNTLTSAFGWVVANVFGPFIKAVKTLGAVWGGEIYAITEIVGEYAGILAQAFSGDFSGAYERVKGFGKFFKETMVTAAEATKQTIAEVWAKPAPAAETPATGAAKPAPDTKSADEAAKLEKQLADERQRNARALMERQERINSLQEEYNRLLQEANQFNGTDKTKKLLDAEKVKGELDREKKAQSEDEQRERERIDKESQRAVDEAEREQKRKAEELARAREQEAGADEQNKLAKMTPDQRRAYFADKQKQLFTEADAADKKGDALTAVQKRTEAKRLQREVDAAPADATDAKAVPRSVLTVDALQRLGGGGNVGSFTDAAQRERERQTGLLERIARAVENQDQKPVPSGVMGP